MRGAYEELRDSATGEAGAAWKAADLEEGNLRALYQELKKDPRFSDEHKAEQAWAKYEATREKIASGKAKAKELLERQARTGERFSIPMPQGELPTTTDTTKLVASQNEASRVVRKLDRIDNGKGGPLKPDRTEILRQEYAKGLEIGGIQGGAICRGVLAAADELGVDADSVVDPFREERHRESLERAQHASRLMDLISSNVPEPPFARPGQRRRGSEPRRRNNALLIPKEAPLLSSGATRRRPWK
jgi:hypothetical protein